MIGLFQSLSNVFTQVQKCNAVTENPYSRKHRKRRKSSFPNLTIPATSALSPYIFLRLVQIRKVEEKDRASVGKLFLQSLTKLTFVFSPPHLKSVIYLTGNSPYSLVLQIRTEPWAAVSAGVRVKLVRASAGHLPLILISPKLRIAPSFTFSTLRTKECSRFGQSSTMLYFFLFVPAVTLAPHIYNYLECHVLMYGQVDRAGQQNRSVAQA